MELNLDNLSVDEQRTILTAAVAILSGRTKAAEPVIDPIPPTGPRLHLDRRAAQLVQVARGDADEWLTRAQVGALLGVSIGWLEKAAREGFGPPCAKIGAHMVRYRRGDLIGWLKGRAAKRS